MLENQTTTELQQLDIFYMFYLNNPKWKSVLNHQRRMKFHSHAILIIWRDIKYVFFMTILGDVTDKLQKLSELQQC